MTDTKSDGTILVVIGHSAKAFAKQGNFTMSNALEEIKTC